MASATFGFNGSPVGWTFLHTTNSDVNYSVPAGQFAIISYSFYNNAAAANQLSFGGQAYASCLQANLTLVGSFYLTTGITFTLNSGNAGNICSAIVQLYNA